MGRRLNVSTSTVINTELVPLDESFYLNVDGQTEQWYYDNTEQYAPNRKVTPLLLVPVISAFDKDTSTSYSPVFNTTQWFANEWNEAQGKYVETEITNQVDSGSADYVIQGNNLLVKKNVSYSHAVTIRCVATYIDPRDSGVTYTVEDSVNLTTNRTADVVFPEVDIISPSGRTYNPLVDDENSQYDFKGVTTNNPVQPLNTDVRRYSVDVDGTEEILNSGEAVAPIMDIRYGDNLTMENQEFMYRQTAGGSLVGESIDKAYIERIKGNTVAWNQLSTNGASEYRYDRDSARTRTLTFSKIPSGRKILLFYLIKDAVESTSGTNTFGIEYGTNKQIYNPIKNGISANIVTLQEERNNVYTFINTGCSSGTAFTMQDFMTFDLTIIYGAGNEPTTPEQFEADYERWFGKPLTYEEYDKGSLRPVLMNAIQTKGKNNSWIKTQNLPITALTGRLDGAGENVTIFPDGLKKAGNVQDEILVEDGVVKAVKRVGGVNLGTLGWTLTNNTSYGNYFYADISNYRFKYNGNFFNTIFNVLEPIHTTTSRSGLVGKDECIAVDGSNNTQTPTQIQVKDSAYSDAATFKSAMNGVMLYYELAEPQTYVLDPITDFVWYGIKDEQEVLADTLPWYVSGQGTDNLVVDAMYGENINVVLRCKMMDGETLSQSKAYATLSWRTPDIEPFVQSNNGGAVRSDTNNMTFDTIVNVNGDVLSDALKQKHLAFNWKIRKNNTSTETDKGWGQRITIDASDLRNVKGSGSSLASTLVGNEVYLLGAYEEVIDDNEVVTDDGQTVFDRPVD